LPNLYAWEDSDLEAKKIQYNVKKEYRKIAVSSMQTKQEMLIYDTLLIMNKLGLLDILQLKGGHCARCHLPVNKHRYTNDLDFNLLEPKAENNKILQKLIVEGFNEFCKEIKLKSQVIERRNNSILVLTRSVQTAHITNSVTIEINKVMPYLEIDKKPVKTFLDLSRVGFEEVVANVFKTEELLGEKLYICGRGNGHRDAYDIFIITEEYPRFFEDFPELSVKRFLQRCHMDNLNLEKVVDANKKAISGLLNKPDKIAELKQMSFQRINSDFIRNKIRKRVCNTLDTILKCLNNSNN
jgi:predicted nucleotidyltransferase component of viral defense system